MSSSEGDSADEFITIETYRNVQEAELAKTHLDAADIEARLLDDGIVGANPLLMNAVGGVKLQVQASREEEALEILATTMSADAGENVCLSCGKPMGVDAAKCEGCGWSYLSEDSES